MVQARARPKGRVAGRRVGGFASRTLASSKLSKRIGWLNKNVGLKSEIRYAKVKDYLSDLGEQRAMRVLKQLELKATDITDPTGYVITAAKRNVGETTGADHGAEVPQSQERGGAGRGAGQGRRRKTSTEYFYIGDEIDEPLGDSLAKLSRKIVARVRWLNANAGLSQDLDLGRVGRGLSTVGPREAMDILSKLQANAEQVRDPDNYVLAALRKRLAGAPVASRASGKRAVATAAAASGRRPYGVLQAHLKGVPRRGGPATAEWEDDDGIRERMYDLVSRLNESGFLTAPIVYNHVELPLLEAGERRSLEILKKLEEGAAEVRDPTAYIAARLRRFVGSGGFVGSPVRAAAAPLMALQAPPGLELPSPRPAGSPSSPVRRSRAGAAVSGEDELWQHVDWLNSTTDLARPVIYERVADALLSIGRTRALEVLGSLEESSSEVRDPNAFIVARARRAAAAPGSTSPRAETARPRAPRPRSFYPKGGISPADSKITYYGTGATGTRRNKAAAGAAAGARTQRRARGGRGK